MTAAETELARYQMGPAELTALRERDAAWRFHMGEVRNGYGLMDGRLFAQHLQDFDALLNALEPLLTHNVALAAEADVLRADLVVAEGIGADLVAAWDEWHRDGLTGQPPEALPDLIDLFRPIATPPSAEAAVVAPKPVLVGW